MKYIKTHENFLERFKVGDIVTCLKAGHHIFLKNYDTYLVTSATGDLINIDNIDQTLNRTRFRLATPEEIKIYTLKTTQNKYNL